MSNERRSTEPHLLPEGSFTAAGADAAPAAFSPRARREDLAAAADGLTGASEPGALIFSRRLGVFLPVRPELAS